MKKTFLLPILLLLASGLFAQQNLNLTAEKILPPFDPTQVQDFVKVCVKTADTGIPMEGVSFKLEFATPPLPSFWMDSLTGPDGCAKAVDLPADCTIMPWKNINLLNGVTTTDAVLISQHILGLQPFDSPYKIIAADVNWSASVSSQDVAHIQGLINGDLDTMPGPSWRFIPADLVFQNPNNPFQSLFPQVLMNPGKQSLQFLGIKMGDVNNSADPNGIAPSDPVAGKAAPTFQQAPPPADTEPPTVVCLNGLNVNFFEPGQITLWASDFLQFVSDNETPAGQIKIGTRKAGTGTGFPIDANGNPVTSITFDCSELGTPSIELWAIDAAGNAAFCQTVVIVEDDLGFCSSGFDSAQVCIFSGCNGEPIEGVIVNIDGIVWFQPPFICPESDSITGPDGCAKIYFPFPNSSFTIAPEKDDDPLNGLSTYDLLLISKHILGIEPLDNPYKMIAADANKSGSITTFDLVELRKLILNVYSELPNNTSWRFVGEGFEFVGIKIGDVDCTATLNGVPPPPPDYPDAFLAMPDTLLLAGQVYEIPIYMAENGLWQGYQFALDFDPQKLKAIGIVDNQWSQSSNWNLLDPGSLTTSWAQGNAPVAFGLNTPIATIRFRALSNVSLKDEVTISAQNLHPEGYAGWDAEKRDLLLTFLPQLKSPPGDPTADKPPPFEPSFEPAPWVDVEAPVVTCLNGLSVNILPTGMIMLWASDFLLSVSDNVTPANEIKIALRKVGTGFGFPLDALGNPVLNLVFDCDELGTVPIELWAKDLAGNTAHCTTSVLVQDNLSLCCGGNLNVNACARSFCSGALFGTAMFQIDGQVNFAPPFSYFDMSDSSGCFGILNSIPIASTFTMSVSKNDDPLNGVTTFDLELISKHIHGTEPFTEPWQWVAADANKDGQVTLEDSVELSKLILGVYLELPNNTSWRFVASGYQFPSPDPLSLPIPDTISVSDIFSNMDTLFLGIKIGDVNCTAVANFTAPPSADKPPPFDPSQVQYGPNDTQAPVVTCLNSLSVNIMPTGMINLWASDFLLSVFDSITPLGQIEIGVRKCGAGTGFPQNAIGVPIQSLLFDCDELGPQCVELWARDLVGNADYCETEVFLQDNLGNYPGGPTAYNIEICVESEENCGLEELGFDISGSHPTDSFYVHDLSGQGFGSCSGYFQVPLGSTASAAPVKDDNPLNGVSTYDMVLISRHIQGTELLNSPYKIIAADADRNGVVNANDIIAIRNLILGIDLQFLNNTSWRFVRKDYVFPDPSNPFLEPFPETLEIQNLQMQVSAEFVAIKVGDVNGTAVCNLLRASEERRKIEKTLSPEIGDPRPNPTTQGATIQIDLENATDTQIEISDLAGRVLWSNRLMLEKGRHTLEIPATAMPVAGVYVWRIRAGDVAKAGKVVRL